MISTDRPTEESKDVQILGDSRFILVRSDEVEDRPWMSESPVCPLLKQHQFKATSQHRLDPNIHM